MSKGSGMGRKKPGEHSVKGCDAKVHSKQCGKMNKVTKGQKSRLYLIEKV